MSELIRLQDEDGGWVYHVADDHEAYRHSPTAQWRPFPRSGRWFNCNAPDEPGEGAVVIDNEGDAWQRIGWGWKCILSDMNLSWPSLMREYGPLRVLS